jgi:amino acid transporter
MSALERAIAHPPEVNGIGRRSPVAGLARRSVGFVDVLAQSVSVVAPAAAATTIPVIVATVAGHATLWAVAAAMLLAVLVGSTINQFARRMSAAGSLYTFVSKGLGTGAAFLSGVSILVGYGFVAMFAIAGSGLYLVKLASHFLPVGDASPLLVSAIIIALAALCFLILALGIRLSTRVTLLVESLSVVLVLVFVVATLMISGGGIDWAVFDVGGTDVGSFATGAVLALMAFVGFESAATLGPEARHPFASIPRAIIWTALASGVLFLLATYGQLAGFDWLGSSLTTSTSPLGDLAGAIGLPWMGLVLDASIAASFFACVVGSTTALVRVVFSMAREGLLSPRLGSTHPRLHTPLFAVAVAVPVIAAVPLATIASGLGVWATMSVLLVTAAAGYITAYLLVCVAAVAFLRRIGELTAWVAVKAIVGAVLLGVGLVIYLASRASSASAFGVWLFLGIVVLGIAVHLWVRIRKPWLGTMIGVYDETTTDDVLGGGAANSRDDQTPGAPGEVAGRE